MAKCPASQKIGVMIIGKVYILAAPMALSTIGKRMEYVDWRVTMNLRTSKKYVMCMR